MEREFSEEIAEVIDGVLAKQFHYSYDREMGLFEMVAGLDGELDRVYIKIRVYTDSFSVHAMCPIKVKNDPVKRLQMAEFVCRASYGLRNGDFEYDMEDGEISFKVFVSCSGGVIPTEEMVGNNLFIPVMMFERYAPGILAVLYGGADPKEAVEDCEKRNS